MTPEIINIALSIGLGLFVGIVLALTGAGGAILSIPLLMFFLGLTITQAAPIGLFALMLSAGVAAILGFKAGNVRYKAAGLMACAGIGMAPVGVWLTHYLPSHIIGIVFSVVLIYVAIRMWRGGGIEQISLIQTPPCQLNPVTSKLFWTAPCTARLSLAGSLAGLLSGLLGVGGGFVIVPTLRKVSDFTMPTIIATSLTVIALVSLSGFLTYLIHGLSPNELNNSMHQTINWGIALPFGISTLVGTLIGKSFAANTPTHIIQRGFSVLALGVALMLLVKSVAS